MKTGLELVAEINALELEKGAVAFWWLGQISYVVKVGTKVLYFDPFLGPHPRRNVPSLLAPEQVSHADWVFGSHDHVDHIDPVAIQGIAAASPAARFVCSRVAARHLRELQVPDDRIVALDAGLVYSEDGVRIMPIAAQHEFFDRDPDLGYPYLSYVVQVDGVTIFHAGDALCYDGLATQLARWPLDLAFVPINGRDAARYLRGCLGNMTYQEAVDLMGALRPRLAVPGHYEMFDGNTEDPQRFAAYMDAKYPGQAYWIGRHGECVVLPSRGGEDGSR